MAGEKINPAFVEKARRMGAVIAPAASLFEAVGERGGRALLVGGCVRDLLLDNEVKDLDVEVYGLDSDTLQSILWQLGSVNLVGQSFAVYKFRPHDHKDFEIDVSLPRRDRKSGTGHKGFTITYDPGLDVKEASRRRDLTANAILYDPLEQKIIDPHGGVKDIERRILRAVDPHTFIEDPLRVLRVAQLAARLEFTVDPETVALCRTVDLGDLPPERIKEEMFKLLLKSRKPSVGFHVMNETRVIDKLFPEIAALRGCEQEPRFHPEGDVFVHTLHALDEAAGFIQDLPTEKQITVMLAVLAHDFGKPAVTARTVEVRDGVRGERIRSINHEHVGRRPAKEFLDRLAIQTINGYPVRNQVIALVEEHLKPPQFYRESLKGKAPGQRAYARIVEKCDPELLARVALADIFGRPPLKKDPAPIEYFRSKVREFGLDKGLPSPVLLGRHLLEAGIVPKPGPEVGRIVKRVYDRQLEGRIASLEEALALARKIADEGNERDTRSH